MTAIAGKGGLIVAGDALGSIHFWDLKTRQHRAFMTNRGAVRRVIFAPEGGGHNILVLFREGGRERTTLLSRCVGPLPARLRRPFTAIRV